MSKSPREIIDDLLEYAVKFAEQNEEPETGGCWDAIEKARAYLAQSVDAVQAGNALPIVVMEINGGVLNCARVTQPVRLIVLDEDTEGGDDENIMEVNGQDAYVHDYHLTKVVTGSYDGIDPEFVASVIKQIEEGQQ